MAGSAVFEWGSKVSGSSSSFEFMFFKGVRYSLYDCVFVRSGFPEWPYIAKLMRLFEDERGVKKVRLRWFFRLQELPFSVRKDAPAFDTSAKAVFVAQGNTEGVENENPVEVLLGKANVLCTAKCRDNLLPSELQVNSAQYVFNRLYDVYNKKLLKMNKIEKSLAQKLFNKPEWLESGRTVPRDDCRSPTSVRDFDVVVSKQVSVLHKPSLKLKIKRSPVEPSSKLEVKRPSMERPQPPPVVKKPSLESGADQLKSPEEVPKHTVTVLYRDAQSQDEIINWD